METKRLMFVGILFALLVGMPAGSLAADVGTVGAPGALDALLTNRNTDYTLGSCTADKDNRTCYFQCDPFSPWGVETSRETRATVEVECSVFHGYGNKDEEPTDAGMFGKCDIVAMEDDDGHATCTGGLNVPII